MDLEELETEMLENRAEIKKLQAEVRELGRANGGFIVEPHIKLKRLVKRVNKMEHK